MNSNVENAGLEKLKEAFREINQWEYENLHLDTLEEVIPSARYKKRIERLIKRQKQPYWRYVNTVGKRVAILVVAIALTFALPMGVSAVREPVVEFFVNVYEKFVEFFYDEDDIAKAPDTIETVYTLGYVPEDYQLESFELKNYASQMCWKNSNNESIIFCQRLLGAKYTLDHEDSDCSQLFLPNITVVFVEKNRFKSFYWNTKEYSFSLTVSSNFSLEEIVNIIESIVIFVK